MEGTLICGTAHTAANTRDRRGDLRARELSHFLPAKCECAAGHGCRKGRSEVQPLLPLSLIRPQFLLAVVPIYPRPFLVDGSFTPATDYRMSAVVNFEATLPATCSKSHCSGSRPFPSVQPSTMVKARKRFQSQMPVRSAVRRSCLNLPFDATCRHSANGSS